MRSQPLAFMSYSRFDDEHDNGYLTKFCKSLSEEVRAHTGKDFPIFQDRESIEWGQNWKERITESIQVVTFLIPIVTPNYFASEPCRDELTQFIEREKRLNRKDLILPIYYITYPKMEKGAKPAADEFIKAIKAHQYRDWRNLRGKKPKSVKYNQGLTKLALEIRSAIDLLQESQEATFEKSLDGIRSALSQDNAQLVENQNKNNEISKNLAERILVVDKNQTGSYSSINEAIMAASPGDRIIVHPGIYEEGLIINKPIEVVGEGDIGSIVVRATNKSALISITPKGLISNLSLQQAGGNWFCVDISYGSIEINRCDITNQGSSCVGIHHGANPLLKCNRIHNSAQGGIFVFDNGEGILEENDIFENAFSGVEIKNFSKPVLRLNRIHDGKQGGVLVHDNGLGLFENNDIFDNISGVEIRSGGNPILNRNQIYNNKEGGVIVHDNGLGILEDNNIFGNGYDGVGIRSKGNPILRHNRIYDGLQGGVFILDEGLGVLENNDIFGNSSDAVAIRSKGNPQLRHNRIFNGKSDGVYIWENGMGVIEDNDIFGNIFGLEIKNESNPIVQRNSIHENKNNGIRILEKGRGILEMNDIFGHSFAEVEISQFADPILRYNKIHDSKQSGVFIHHESKGLIENNDIYRNGYSGIEIAELGNPMIKHNNIHNDKQNGILIHGNGRGTLSGNNILWNEFAGIEIQKKGKAVISHNYINMNMGEAIRIHNEGTGIIEDNDLRGNGRGAWAIDNDVKELKKERNLE